MDPFLGEIIMFGGNFAPRGWAFCDGQILPISQNESLYSLLGTTYGGDGRTTFALPDLRGRSAIGPRQGAGLSNYSLGQRGGRETVTLSVANMPSHNHTLVATSENGNTSAPADARFGDTVGFDKEYNNTDNNLVNMKSNIIGNTGGGQNFDIHSPFLAVNFIIALQGTFPSRN